MIKLSIDVNGTIYGSWKQAERVEAKIAQAEGKTDFPSYHTIMTRKARGHSIAECFGFEEITYSYKDGYEVANQWYESKEAARQAISPPGLSMNCIVQRLRAGYAVEEAFLAPACSLLGNTITLDDGQTHYSLKAAAKAYGQQYSTVEKRLNRWGWSMEEALGIVPRINIAGAIYGIFYKGTLLYVGQTTGTVVDRFERHFTRTDKGSNNSIDYHMDTHSRDDYTVETFKTTEEGTDLNQLEKFYINKYDTFNNGYNLTRGGGAARPQDRHGIRIAFHGEKYNSMQKFCNKYKLDTKSITTAHRVMEQPEFEKYVEGIISKRDGRNEKYKTSLKYGVGINDGGIAGFTSDSKTGKRTVHQPYKFWDVILRNCYDPKANKASPLFHDVTVCEEWKTRTTFEEWFEKQAAVGELVIFHRALDPNSKIFSPKTTMMLPKNIVALINNKAETIRVPTGDNGYPPGIQLQKKSNKFIALFTTPKGLEYGRVKRIGISFDTVEEAAYHYNKVLRADYIREVASKQTNHKMKAMLLLHAEHFDNIAAQYEEHS